MNCDYACAAIIFVGSQSVIYRCSQETEKRREELKRLKNLKKREILEKIEKLKNVTGGTAIGFTEDDVDGEFDEREHDKMMKVVVGFFFL